MSDLLVGSNLEPELMAIFRAAFAREWFRQVALGYEAKAQGKADSLGNRWPNIKPETKAYHRPDLRRNIRLGTSSKHRPTLTKAQDREWREEFKRQLRKNPTIRKVYEGKRQQYLAFFVQMEEIAEAESRAASLAWIYVKNRFGAKTLLDKLGGKKAPIMVRSGDLLQSYLPGDGLPYEPSPGQVFRPKPLGLVLGSQVSYAGPAARRRQVQPRGNSAWARNALRAGIQAVKERLSE